MDTKTKQKIVEFKCRCTSVKSWKIRTHHYTWYLRCNSDLGFQNQEPKKVILKLDSVEFEYPQGVRDSSFTKYSDTKDGGLCKQLHVTSHY